MSIRAILLVDDRERYRTSIRAILHDEGYHVYEAVSGEEGLELTRTLRPDLVIMGEAMRLPSGMTMIEALRLNPSSAGLATLTLVPHSSSTSSGTEPASLQCIRHPIRPREVREVVARRIGPALP